MRGKGGKWRVFRFSKLLVNPLQNPSRHCATLFSILEGYIQLCCKLNGEWRIIGNEMREPGEPCKASGWRGSWGPNSA
jgi:hypothetical protein